MDMEALEGLDIEELKRLVAELARKLPRPDREAVYIEMIKNQEVTQ